MVWVVGCGEVAGDAVPSDRDTHVGGVMWLKRDASQSQLSHAKQATAGPWTKAEGSGSLLTLLRPRNMLTNEVRITWTGRPSPELGEARRPIQRNAADAWYFSSLHGRRLRWRQLWPARSGMPSRQDHPQTKPALHPIFSTSWRGTLNRWGTLSETTSPDPDSNLKCNIGVLVQA